jgi:hypothetical protein
MTIIIITHNGYDYVKHKPARFLTIIGKVVLLVSHTHQLHPLTVNGMNAAMEYPYMVSSCNNEYRSSVFLHIIKPQRRKGRHQVYEYMTAVNTITSWK